MAVDRTEDRNLTAVEISPISTNGHHIEDGSSVLSKKISASVERGLVLLNLLKGLDMARREGSVKEYTVVDVLSHIYVSTPPEVIAPEVLEYFSDNLTKERLSLRTSDKLSEISRLVRGGLPSVFSGGRKTDEVESELPKYRNYGTVSDEERRGYALLSFFVALDKARVEGAVESNTVDDVWHYMYLNIPESEIAPEVLKHYGEKVGSIGEEKYGHRVTDWGKRGRVRYSYTPTAPFKGEVINSPVDNAFRNSFVESSSGDSLNCYFLEQHLQNSEPL